MYLGLNALPTKSYLSSALSVTEEDTHQFPTPTSGPLFAHCRYSSYRTSSLQYLLVPEVCNHMSINGGIGTLGKIH